MTILDRIYLSQIQMRAYSTLTDAMLSEQLFSSLRLLFPAMKHERIPRTTAKAEKIRRKSICSPPPPST